MDAEPIWSSASPLLGFEDIAPLTSITTLRRLRIVHPRPLVVTDDDVRSLCTAWPLLDSLFLNPCPLVHDDVPLTALCLGDVARLCPHVHQLGLYINALQDIPYPTKGSIQRFRELECLYLDASPVPEDHDQLLLFLARVLSPDTYMRTSHPGLDAVEPEGEYAEQWQFIAKAVPLMIAYGREVEAQM